MTAIEPGANSQYQSLLKDAILELRRMQSKLDTLQNQQTESIALIGMACRFPGGATTPEHYWELLASGQAAVQDIPPDRWIIDDYYDANPDAPGKMYTRSGCFIDRVADFDAQRFGIAPREAIALDPQQRLLLEVTHEALERAGQPIDQLKGSRTGVFMGVCFDDYGRTSITSGDPTYIDAYSSLGNTRSIAAGRIAYVFGLQGPTLQLDTTCSSSLVALHLACQSLRLRESDRAIVGGVNLILAPEPMIGFCKLKALSPDGHCKPFDASANGYGRGEGCGIVVLKRLSDAIADQDPILAVIRGSAVNHDGASNGLTAPNGLAQQAVIRQALTQAQVTPQDIDYVEAHGTGTVLGDPIEVLALAEVFAQNRLNPLYIGSVKANIGHLEAAAGVAGLIKLVLSLQHQQIPPHRYAQPSPHIPWQQLPIALPSQLTPWRGDRRLAGISSFGMSGTNAHVILESAPTENPPVVVPPSPFAEPERPLHLLAISAKTPKALIDLVQRYLDWFIANPDRSLADASFSANTGRSHLEYRLSFVATTLTAAHTSLQAKLVAAIDHPPQKIHHSPKLAIRFLSERGAYSGMGTLLYQTQPQFRQAIDRCAAQIQPYLGRPLLTQLHTTKTSPGSALDVFALEYALYHLWQSWGIQPDIVLGEGVGVYVAACVAGVFSLEDALKLVIARDRLCNQPSDTGRSLSTVAQDITYHPPQLCLISPQIGEITGAEITRADTWSFPVPAFTSALPDLFSAPFSCTMLLDIGIQSTPAMSDSVSTRHLPGLTAEQSEWDTLLSNLGALYEQGVSVNWVAFDRNYQRRRIDIPTYPFQRQRFWRDRPQASIAIRSPIHPLLGSPITLARSSQIYFETYLSQTTPTFLKHHRVFGQVILPASAYIEMAIAAGKFLCNAPSITLTSVNIEQMWLVPESTKTSIQCIASPLQSKKAIVSYQFEWLSLTTENNTGSNFSPQHWQTHFTTQIQSQCPQVISSTDLFEYQSQCTEELSTKTYYQQCQVYGIDYGKDFQTIQTLHRDQQRQQAIAWVQLPSHLTPEIPDYSLHPTLLDGCLQAIGALLPNDSLTAYLPVGCQQLTLYQSAAEGLWSLAQWQERSALTVNLQLVNGTGELIAEMIGLQLKAVNALVRSPATSVSTLRLSPRWQNWLYRIEWQAHPAPIGVIKLPSPEAVCQHLTPIYEQLLTQPAVQAYADTLPQLELLSLHYISQAFQQLGCDFSALASFSITERMHQMAIAPSQQPLFHRLLDILAAAGQLEIRGDVCRVQQSWMPPELVNQPISSIEATLLERTGSRLAEILRGDCDPLQLLFPEGDVRLLTQLYQDSPGATVMNTLVQQAIAQMQDGLPVTQPLRILEIGAGTGGTTAHILPQLQADHTDYVFTDVSPLFLSNARQKFADYPFVRYECLDIERSPQDQGFTPHSFHIVVAANVLHATQDLRQTLIHVRQLLAPGGCLILLEGTLPLRWVDLIFGLTEGWWRFQDHELRPHHPLIAVEQWQRLLQTTGFKTTIALQPDTYPNQETAFQSILIANTPANISNTNSINPFKREIWLILQEEPVNQLSLGLTLSSHLEKLQHSAQLISTSELTDFVSILTQTSFDRIIDLRSLTNSRHLESDTLPNRVQHQCQELLKLIQAIIQTSSSPSPQLAIVTQGAITAGTVNRSGLIQSPLCGIEKVLRLEHPELNSCCLDLDPNQPLEAQTETLLAALLDETIEEHMAWRQGQWQVARLVQDESFQDERDAVNDRLTLTQRGNLDQLHFAAAERRSPAADEVEIQVQATGLNFRDVLNALDLYPGEAGDLGCECVGKVVRLGEQVNHLTLGQSVMALTTGSFSRYVTVNGAMVVPCPTHLAPADVATIPVAFLTANYALRHLAQLQPGDRVLIHVAAGGVGQAAIQIAQQIGAEIFATASPDKQALVRSLGVDHVFNSRTLEFAEQILTLTNGAGVDVVLNSLSGDFIPKSCSILKSRGCFLEIGKLDIWSTEQFAQVRPQARYCVIDVVELCQQQPEFVQSQLQAIATEFQAQNLQPLPHQTYDRDQIRSAFRTMQQGKHTGKLVLTQNAVQAVSELILHPDRTYLITGGLGGLGLQVAEWLIQQGARHLVLVGRNPDPAVVHQLQAADRTIQAIAADVSQRSALVPILETIRQSGYPLAGVVHAAGVLADATLRHLDATQIAAVMLPKVGGAWHLHELTQNQPLDFFVLFSSATVLFGSPGQANHVAANTFLDALAHYRQAQGLPALSINWGTWSQVGAAAARQADARIQQLGIGAIAPEVGRQTLSPLIGSQLVQVGVIPIDWAHFLQHDAASPLFAAFRQQHATVPSGRMPSTLSTSATSDILQVLTTAPDRTAVLTEFVRSQIAQILGFQPSDIDPQKGFFDLGMDSLTSVELKSRLQTALNCTLPTTVAFDYPTLERLIPYLLTQVEENLPENTADTASEPIPAQPPDVRQTFSRSTEISSSLPSDFTAVDLTRLSDADIATLLAQELMHHELEF